ncbi:MAG: hypothetical protein KAT71_04125 [Gammaproteobacteria bacterium]|nr:hypothetical protein [Gammaproteobacteria bacterium]
MTEINFTTLQLQVETLINLRIKLNTENKLLRKKLAQMIQERAVLTNKMSNAQQKLNSVISKIKEEIL